MSAQTQVRTGPITRAEWERVVARHDLHRIRTGWRRRNARYQTTHGEAKLVFELPVGKRRVPIVRTTAVLEISAKGVAVRSHQPIPTGTGVGIELNLEGVPVILVGNVVHSTLSVGGYQVGIELRFPGDDPNRAPRR